MDVILTAVRPRHYSDGDQMGVFHVSGMETATNKYGGGALDCLEDMVINLTKLFWDSVIIE